VKLFANALQIIDKSFDRVSRWVQWGRRSTMSRKIERDDSEFVIEELAKRLPGFGRSSETVQKKENRALTTSHDMKPEVITGCDVTMHGPLCQTVSRAVATAAHASR
jgi:hypothetical protein